jgi:hypothetical protein
MSFRIRGLSPEPFQELFALDDDELGRRAVRRVTAEEPHAAPCRVTLEDAEPGERLLLLPFDHQTAHSPYRASGPIFVREAARTPFDRIGELPTVFNRRVLSVRAYDAAGLMTDADIVESDPRRLFETFFADREVETIHVHFARRGCFACRVDRA